MIMNALSKLLMFIIKSPSRGVALAKLLVPIIGIIVLIIISWLGMGDNLLDKFQWINNMLKQ